MSPVFPLQRVHAAAPPGHPVQRQAACAALSPCTQLVLCSGTHRRPERYPDGRLPGLCHSRSRCFSEQGRLSGPLSENRIPNRAVLWARPRSSRNRSLVLSHGSPLQRKCDANTGNSSRVLREAVRLYFLEPQASTKWASGRRRGMMVRLNAAPTECTTALFRPECGGAGGTSARRPLVATRTPELSRNLNPEIVKIVHQKNGITVLLGAQALLCTSSAQFPILC